MSTTKRVGFFLAVAMAAGGCATSGIGSGQLESTTTTASTQNRTVEFSWHADPTVTRGTMRASLPDGRSFQGQFIQISSTTQTVDLDPYWGGWGPWGGYDSTGFARHYSGRVIAQLHGADNQRMRCQFQLAVPEQGPRSGGFGQCELSTGERVEFAELRGEP